MDMEVDADQLSPTSLRTQLVAYQNTVKDLYDQNQRNAEILGRLETAVNEKDSEISRLQFLEMETDLRIEVQQRDFQHQLTSEQNAWQEISNTLQELCRELETISANQNNQNPMEVSLSTEAVTELDHIKQKAEEEKHSAEERLAKAKANHKQVLKDKNHEITIEIERIKKQMEDQMHCERETSAKANEHQLQTIMLELHSLKEKHDRDKTDRKAEEKVLLDNIKASINPILKSNFKGGEHVGIGMWLKGLQEEVTNFCPPTVNKKHGSAVSTDDTIVDWTLGTEWKHVHFASTPVKPEVSNINLNVTPPIVPKEYTITESILHNTM